MERKTKNRPSAVLGIGLMLATNKDSKSFLIARDVLEDMLMEFNLVHAELLIDLETTSACGKRVITMRRIK